jgi:3-phosphoglycerate kinase
MKLRSLTRVKNLAHKTVLLRIDANVPFKQGKILDDYKLVKTLPTLRYLLQQQARVIIVSHLGRPQGYDKKLSLRPIANYFEKKLKHSVLFVDFSPQSRAGHFEYHFSDLKKYGILAREHTPQNNLIMLENIRFDEDEEKDTGVLAKKLSQFADIFVLDGFGVAHRRGASVTGVARFLPAYAGLLLEQEVRALTRVVEKPQHPLVVILGGAKMETKIPLVKNFLSKADYILLSGGIIATYLWYQGKRVGSSLVERELAPGIFKLFKNKKIILPTDVIVGTVQGKKTQVVSLTSEFSIPADDQGIYDIGPETILLYHNLLKKARTIIWNGGLGYFEQKPYNAGTEALARMIVKETKRGAFSVCGGGETEQLLRQLKLEQKISLVSTGGGAMLEFLSGKKLPGITMVEQT